MKEEEDGGVGGVVEGIVDVALEGDLVVGELDNAFFEGRIGGRHVGGVVVKMVQFEFEDRGQEREEWDSRAQGGFDERRDQDGFCFCHEKGQMVYPNMSPPMDSTAARSWAVVPQWTRQQRMGEQANPSPARDPSPTRLHVMMNGGVPAKAASKVRGGNAKARDQPTLSST